MPGQQQLPLHPPNSPALHHYVALLGTISHSESSLTSLRSYAQSELHLLNNYFAVTTARLTALQPLTKPSSSADPTERQRAVDERREKWAELHAMQKYGAEMERLHENVRRREELESRLRGLLREVGEVLLEREVLAGEGRGIDAV